MTARLIIAAPSTGQGKTTVATGLMAALTRRGLKVQGFKSGPDYIDPTFHTAATGRPSRNLDTWMMGEDLVLESFERATRGADIAIIEGVMGMFDGYGGTDDAGSAAHLARLLNAPVLLVVDGWAMARSAAALVHGFATFDRRVKVAGVVMNNLAGEGHYRFVREAMEGSGVPLVGWLRKEPALALPERHLGLVPGCGPGHLERLAAAMEAGLDLEAVVAMARNAGQLPGPRRRVFPPAAPAGERLRLAVARDAAFWLYYQDSLDYLEALGAELLPFSPIEDPAPPDGAQAIYLGGGYPELHLEALAANRPMLHRMGQTTIPLYAECGGLMYLAEAIRDREGRSYPMAGRLPAEATMEGGGLRLGYATATAACDHLLARAGEVVRGHEFHASGLTAAPDRPAWSCRNSFGDHHPEGFALPGILASYLHLHLPANPTAAKRFIDAARLCNPA